MLSKNKARFIVSLQRKKERDLYKLFLIEGEKVVSEYLQSGKEVLILAAKPEWIGSLPAPLKGACNEIIPVSHEELKSISTLHTPHKALAVVPYNIDRPIPLPSRNRLFALLDNVQDPGNMGTIIRAAAWFGIEEIICSENTVDVYNPKVIQATMGAFMRVGISYCNLQEYLSNISDKGIPVYSASLDGESIYGSQLSDGGLILFGNESKGVSPLLEPYVTQKILIPGRSGKGNYGLESLNVSMAASVIFSEFARRKPLT